jgi:hypothetical protein
MCCWHITPWRCSSQQQAMHAGDAAASQPASQPEIRAHAAEMRLCWQHMLTVLPHAGGVLPCTSTSTSTCTGKTVNLHHLLQPPVDPFPLDITAMAPHLLTVIGLGHWYQYQCHRLHRLHLECASSSNLWTCVLLVHSLVQPLVCLCQQCLTPTLACAPLPPAPSPTTSPRCPATGVVVHAPVNTALYLRHAAPCHPH